MGLDCEVSQCCLVRFLEQGYLRELACKADKAFLLLIMCPTDTHRSSCSASSKKQDTRIVSRLKTLPTLARISRK